MLRLTRYITALRSINLSYKKKIAGSFVLVLVLSGIIFFAFQKNKEQAFYFTIPKSVQGLTGPILPN